ncbi:MAG: hypothetical protein KC421_07305 [Anaerolineales bacterium]|nr:hypothetical protein [Anaerolineales bacterium]
MYSRVISVYAKPGRLEDVKQLIEKSIMPAARRYAGFHYWCQMSSPETNKMMSITLWGNESDMNAFGNKELAQIMTQLQLLIEVDTLAMETFHVDLAADAIPAMIVDQISDAILVSA